MSDADRDNLEKTVAEIRARWGMHAIRPLGQQTPVSRTATGFSALDRILAGGLPRGRITEISGSPTSGIVTLSFSIMAQVQARGEMAIYLDLEQTFDPYYAARCGVVLDRMLLVRPATLRQGLRVLEELVAGDVAVLVCDLPLQAPASPVAEILANSLERLLAPLSRSNVALIYLASQAPGTSESTGDLSWQVPHYATVRLLARRQRWLYRRQDIRGCCVQVRVLKNKGGAAGASANVNVIFDKPLNDDGESEVP